MAKSIKYKFVVGEDTPEIEPIFLEKCLQWSEANEEIAAAEAYNGEYTVEDDGLEETEETTERTQEERIKDLEEALEMLLSGVTE